MAAQRLAHEPLSRQKVSLFTQQEFDCVAHAVDGAVEIHPPAANLDAGLVHVPPARDGALTWVEAFRQHWREAFDPAIDGGMIDYDASFSHHLLQITQAQIVDQIPADTQQNDGLIEVAAFEHHADPDWIALMPSSIAE